MTFDPCLHGWAFENRFRRGPFTYGLCGGMVFAALDRYLFDVAMPETTAPPQSGPLWRELVRRQVDSMDAAMLRQLWEWVHLSDSDLAWAAHVEQTWVVKHLPAPLVLIRSRGLRDLTKSHQVLAIDADEDKLYLYDPNCPGQWAWLRWDYDDTTLIHSHAGPQRGMFVQDYEPRKP